MPDKVVPEPVERAQSKVNAQRDKIAKMSLGDPRRLDEERILEILVENAELARTAHLLLDEDDNTLKDDNIPRAQPLSPNAILELRDALLAPVPGGKHKRPPRPKSKVAPPRPFGKRKGKP